MTTAWLHRYHLIVPAAAREAAQSLCAAIGPGGEAERMSFDCALSPSGELPATHFAASGQLTEAMRQALAAVAAAGQLPPGAAWYRCDLDDVLVQSNRPSVAERVGGPFAFQDALADLELRQAFEPAW